MIEKGIRYFDGSFYRGRGGRTSVYPFMEMEVGDSYFVEGATSTDGLRPYKSALQYARRAGDGRKFSARKVEGGVRIWRVA